MKRTLQEVQTQQHEAGWPTRDHIPVVHESHEGAVHDIDDLTPFQLREAEVTTIEEVAQAEVNQVRAAVRQDACNVCSSPDCA